MEFYLAMKKNEILSFAGKWMELENILLSEAKLKRSRASAAMWLTWDHMTRGEHIWVI
jgi:hypothetical protein